MSGVSQPGVTLPPRGQLAGSGGMFNCHRYHILGKDQRGCCIACDTEEKLSIAENYWPNLQQYQGKEILMMELDNR